MLQSLYNNLDKIMGGIDLSEDSLPVTGFPVIS